MNGSEYVYVPVEANAVATIAEGGSGGDAGYSFEGYYINWNYDLGIINQSWDNAGELTNSPFFGYSKEDIQNIIDNEGNLNRIFSEWASKYSHREQLIYVLEAMETYGEHNIAMGLSGCVGDQII